MPAEVVATAIAVRRAAAGAPAAEVLLLKLDDGRVMLPSAPLVKGEIPKQTALRALWESTGLQADLRAIDARFYKMTTQVFRKGIDKEERQTHFFRVNVPPGATFTNGDWLPAEAALAVIAPAGREILAEALK